MADLSYVASGTDENKFTYNGKELEDEFGLNWYHYGARFYDPTVGRWWNVDPVDELISPYNYVGNDPVNYTDPNGMFRWRWQASIYRFFNGGEVDFATDRNEWFVGKQTGTTGTLDNWDFTVHYQRTFERQGIDLLDVRDFAAGYTSTLTWGYSDKFFDSIGKYGYRNQNSLAHSSGEWTGFGVSIFTGGRFGWNSSGVKQVGKEFSHWVPRRTLKNTNDFLKKTFGNSKWNGNYVSTKMHALTDPWRYRFMKRTWKSANPIYNTAVRQILRVPFVYTGSVAGAAYGTAGINLND